MQDRKKGGPKEIQCRASQTPGRPRPGAQHRGRGGFTRGRHIWARSPLTGKSTAGKGSGPAGQPTRPREEGGPRGRAPPASPSGGLPGAAVVPDGDSSLRVVAPEPLPGAQGVEAGTAAPVVPTLGGPRLLCATVSRSLTEKKLKKKIINRE